MHRKVVDVGESPELDQPVLKAEFPGRREQGSQAEDSRHPGESPGVASNSGAKTGANPQVQVFISVLVGRLALLAQPPNNEACHPRPRARPC